MLSPGNGPFCAGPKLQKTSPPLAECSKGSIPRWLKGRLSRLADCAAFLPSVNPTVVAFAKNNLFNIEVLATRPCTRIDWWWRGDGYRPLARNQCAAELITCKFFSPQIAEREIGGTLLQNYMAHCLATAAAARGSFERKRGIIGVWRALPRAECPCL
jgi:hypothetical protein